MTVTVPIVVGEDAQVELVPHSYIATAGFGLHVVKVIAVAAKLSTVEAFTNFMQLPLVFTIVVINPGWNIKVSSALLVTVPVVVIGPPDNPCPVTTLVTVPGPGAFICADTSEGSAKKTIDKYLIMLFIYFSAVT